LVTLANQSPSAARCEGLLPPTNAINIFSTMRARSILWLTSHHHPTWLLCLALGTWFSAASCLPTRNEGDLRRIPDREDPGDAGSVVVDGGIPSSTPDGSVPPQDPYGLQGLSPNHGSFQGGQRVVLQGTGFTSKTKVFFGNNEVDNAQLVPISSKKLQAITPGGAPGPVDVHIQVGDDSSTRRTLPSAYVYDSFYTQPSQGPTSGGTQITLKGSGTQWNASTTITIGNKPCPIAAVLSPTEITCTAPAHTAGSKTVTTKNTNSNDTLTVLDAFTYADTDNGFRGGLSGEPLAGSMRVLAFDSYTGVPVVGAHVLIGESMVNALKGVVNGQGLAEFKDDALHQPVNVTVAKGCYQPTSFVAVPVDTVIVYLDPVLTPECIPPEGEIPPVGGKAGIPALVTGEIVFPSSKEFTQGTWDNLPKPANDQERRVAYVFPTTTNPQATFRLPTPEEAITEANSGTIGYGFQFNTRSGNQAIYALAGIENRTQNPPSFLAYWFGVTQGVSAQAGQTTENVQIKFVSPMDHQVTLDVYPPTPGPKGPDRMVTSVALRLGNDGYAIFPQAQRTTFLPFAGNISTVGLPALGSALPNATYTSTAFAATGPSLTLPRSLVGNYQTISSSQVVTIDSFVQVPVLQQPKAGTPWDASSFSVTFPTQGVIPDVLVMDVQSAGGTIGWTIASPGNITSFSLPDLRKLSKGGGLAPGPVSVSVSAAQIFDFKYSELRYRNLNNSSWFAYSEDVYYVQLSSL
jgi:hypothetical protein